MQKPADILVFNFKHKLQSINKAVAGVDSFMVEKNVTIILSFKATENYFICYIFLSA